MQDVQAAQVALGTAYTESFDVQSAKFPELAGRITISLPDGRDTLRMGVVQHRLRQGVPLEELDQWTQATVLMLSTLAVVVREAPDWWYEIKRETQRDGAVREVERRPAPELVKDLDLLWEIHGRYAAFRGTFPRPRPDRGAGEAAAGA